MREDKADIVEIEIHSIKLQFSNQTYPHPTREDIYTAAMEFLEANTFSYSEKRISHKEESVSEQLMNDLEPISSSLETFGDIDDSHYIKHNIPQSHTTTTSIGRDSKEQGGDREANQYNTERDPLNE